MKNHCKSRADDERRNELADDEVENLDEDRAKETVSFCLSFRRKSLASRADDRADETETEVRIEETEEREAI